MCAVLRRVLTALLLVASVQGWSHLSAAALRTSSRNTQRLAVQISLLEEDAVNGPMLDGELIKEGDGLLVSDDSSGAWWRASVVQTRDQQVLVHYTGCDPAWDEWFDADSPKIARMDAVEQRKDNSAFQSDTIEDDIDDEELLDQYRKSRWDQNARWQLNVFAEEQQGSWEGTVERYDADGAGGVRPAYESSDQWAACSNTIRVCASDTIEVVDKMPTDALLALSTQLGTTSFRPELGSMAVASAFSLATPTAADGWLIELAIREESRRVRCKLLYEPSEADEGGLRAMALASLGIVREVSAKDGAETSGSPDADDFFVEATEGEADLDGPRRPGRGLYDPPPGDRGGYISLYLQGGMTLVFPTAVSADTNGFISLDWVAGNMRYQIDRKFATFDGTLSSLELTEILKTDADRMPPDFPHQSGGQR